MMTPPTILFGAFDRHNFGDLLFPHIAAALLPERRLVFAGLTERDMRPWGGHPVHSLQQAVEAWGQQPVRLLHVGGETLSCEAWQAAVMLQPPSAAQVIVKRLAASPTARQAWTESVLGAPNLAPYCAAPKLFPCAQRVVYTAAGGVELGESSDALRDEVFHCLRSANTVGVRDRLTLAHLRNAGIAARLMPDPAVMVAELFGPSIEAHAARGELADIRNTFPHGYIAVQLSADFGDDATLNAIASQLDLVATTSGLGIVLFRAGSAPWHDDLDSLQRLATRFQARPPVIFNSLHLWDICALIAESRAYCGSSLHGRIVATAFCLPRLNILHPGQAGRPTKQAAYAATWEAPGHPGAVHVGDLANSLARSLATDPAQRRRTAHDLAILYRQNFANLNP